MMDTNHYSARETLKDGTQVIVRAIRHEDGNAILDAFEGLDRESIYRRFFTPKKKLSENELEALTDIDFRQVVALVVTVPGEDGEVLIGGGRYAVIGKGTAEIAFLTDGRYRRLGIASLILRHLSLIARANGVRRFEAEVLAENRPMLAVFGQSALPMQTKREGTLLLITLELGEQESESESHRDDPY
jgi:GNAT superfamily N-acetyltransferase